MKKQTRLVMFSSKTNEHPTPQAFFDEHHKKYNFTLDPCCTAQNAKCPRYFTLQDNGLTQDWTVAANESVFVNPPYSEVKDWVAKAYNESLRGNRCVLLLPVRTDTKYFHEFILGKAELIFIKGRLKFGEAKNAAPFPSMLVIYRPQTTTETVRKVA